MAIAVAAATAGVVGGLLLAARVPLWPTARRPVIGGWDGYWRSTGTGELEPFAAALECTELPDHRLERAALLIPDLMQCRYEPVEGRTGDPVIVELVRSPVHAVTLLHASYPGRVTTADERVAVPEGTASGRRTTVRSASAATVGLDSLVVGGDRITVEVTCLDFGGGVDLATCHATQAAFFASWKGGAGSPGDGAR